MKEHEILVTAEAARTAADATVSKAALSATIAGSSATVYGGYTLNDWAIVIGMLLAAAGFIVQVYSAIDSRRTRKAKDRRDAEWHKTRMAAIEAGDSSPQTDSMGLFADTRESVQ